MTNPTGAPLPNPQDILGQLAAAKSAGQDPSSVIAGLAALGGGEGAPNPMAALAMMKPGGAQKQVIIDDDLKEAIRNACSAVQSSHEIQCRLYTAQLELINSKAAPPIVQ